MPEMITLVGDKNQPDVFDEEVAMMLFISELGKQNRHEFENGRVYVSEEW